MYVPTIIATELSNLTITLQIRGVTQKSCSNIYCLFIQVFVCFVFVLIVQNYNKTLHSAIIEPEFVNKGVKKLYFYHLLKKNCFKSIYIFYGTEKHVTAIKYILIGGFAFLL